MYSCQPTAAEKISYWESYRNKFGYRNLKEFTSDSILRKNYKTYYKIKLPLIGKEVSGDEIYLYSWQDRGSSTNEFTVIGDDGELGLKIFYLIFNSKGGLLSTTQVAGKGSEGGYWFELKSKFISKDSILRIGTMTQWWDVELKKKMEKTKGDSSFSFLVIDKFGKMNSIFIKQKNELSSK